MASAPALSQILRTPTACFLLVTVALVGGAWRSPQASATKGQHTTTVRTIQFRFTLAEGWLYSGTIPWPTESLRFSKDISSSPPGQAQLRVSTIGNGPKAPRSLSDTNPGRPDGPATNPTMMTYFFSLPTTNSIGGWQENVSRCAQGGVGEITEFGGNELTCVLEAGDGSTPDGESQPLPEALVAQLANALNTQTPRLLIQFPAEPNGECYGFVPASGTATYHPENSGCESITFTVTTRVVRHKASRRRKSTTSRWTAQGSSSSAAAEGVTALAKV